MLRILLLALGLLAAAAADAGAADKGTALDAYARGDYATAARRWRPMAEAGNAEAQFLLATLYARGQGVARDPATAYKWYWAAAAQKMDGANASLRKLTASMSKEELERARQLIANWKPPAAKANTEQEQEREQKPDSSQAQEAPAEPERTEDQGTPQ
jgi:TPR repeat protein